MLLARAGDLIDALRLGISKKWPAMVVQYLLIALVALVASLDE